MPAAPPPPRAQLFPAGMRPSLLVVALATLRALPPRLLACLPGCPIYRLTGLRCPGCGATRALLALLHGNLPAAWHSNPLFLLLLLPLTALVLARSAPDRLTRPRPQLPRAVLAALLLVTATFTIARNL